MLEIDLDDLREGLPGFTPIAGSFLAEATAYCLELSGHQAGVELTLQIDNKNRQVPVHWRSDLSTDAASTWQDELELVEYAAAGIALLLILKLTDYTDIQRARKGSSVDFWLGQKDENGFPVLEALLEISGILKENRGNSLKARVEQKKRQVKRSPYKNLPVYVVVVEFSGPKANLEKL